MKYSLYSTLNEILGEPGMQAYLPFFYSMETLGCFPKEYDDAPLALARFQGKTDWSDNLCEAAEQLLEAANMIHEVLKGKRRTVVPGTGNAWVPDGSRPYADPSNVFLLTPKIPKKVTELKPALIICPGGGYEFVSFANEGNPIARRAEKDGFAPFILHYSVSPARFPKPQMDLVEAIVYVRKHAASYGADPDRIGIVGFSAAGHLAATTMCVYEHLAMGISEDAALHPPKAIALGYPVITFAKGKTHEGSFLALTGGDESLREKLSFENMLKTSMEKRRFPDTFVFTCADDDLVPPVNAKILKDALDAEHIPCEYHLYPTGGHGCGLAFDKSASPWSGEMLRFFHERLDAGRELEGRAQ